MRAEDLQVQRELIKAGYDGSAVGCRGAMHETLEQMLRDDPNNADFVDRLRTLLGKADHHDDQVELDQARAEHVGLKACPECRERPDIVQSRGRVLIVCMNHAEGAIFQEGASVSAAIARWNCDKWTDVDNKRELFSLKLTR